MPLASLALLAAILAAAPADAAPLAPQGAWIAHPIGGHCAVARSYGDGAPMLILRQRRDGARIDIDLIGVAEPRGTDARIPPRVTAPPGGRAIAGRLDLIAMMKGPPMLEVVPMEQPFADLASVATLAVGFGHDAPISFTIDRHAEAQAMPRDWHDALVRSWGIEPAQFSPLSGATRRFLGASAYPAAAAARHEEGRVSVLIEIPPSGHGGACRVVESSGSASLDQATCDIARNKASFTPATDDAGKPKTVWTIMAMRWKLPG